MKVNLLEILKTITNVADYINPIVNNHHFKVATVSYFISKELGLAEQQRRKLIVAALLHDIGGFSLQERIDTINFEISPWNRHEEVGGKLLQSCRLFSSISSIVYNHHQDYKNRDRLDVGEDDFLLSQIINVSDRFVILSRKSNYKSAYGYLKRYSERKFSPYVLKSLGNVYNKDILHFELLNNGIRFYEDEFKHHEEALDDEDLESLFLFITKIVDFKSPFTCAHSLGISEVAENMGNELKMNSNDVRLLKLSGMLHDVGKIAIPSEIINKNGKLTKKEYLKIRQHIYYSCQILKNVSAFEKIYDYAVHHHERLDGKGYPFGYDASKLSDGAKIMAVADVYMALMEDRPYRKGMKQEEAKKIMLNLAKKNKLEMGFVEVVFRNSLFSDIVEKNKQKGKSYYASLITNPNV